LFLLQMSQFNHFYIFITSYRIYIVVIYM